MARRSKQQEMAGIDKTPLAVALNKAAKAADAVDKAKEGLDAAAEGVLAELKAIDKTSIVHQGRKFTIKKTPEKEKLHISKPE